MGRAALFDVSGRKTPTTPAESLRELLDALEQGVGYLPYSETAAVLELPRLFDRAAALLADLRARGAEVAAEGTRFDTVAAQYRSKAALFLRRIGGAAMLSAERERVAPEESAWWWTVDLWLAAQRRAATRRRLRWGAAALVLLGVLSLVYARFIAPDPITRAVFSYQFRATDLAAAGDYVQALEQVELALALSPGEAALLTFKGVLQEALGDVAAQETLAAAERACADREKYLTLRGQFYLQLGQLEAVWETAEALLAVNARSAVAYLYRGMAAEGLGDPAQALADYTRAGELAQEQQQHEIYVTARNLLGNLLMQGGP